MSHRWWWEGGEWGRFSSSSAPSLTEKSPPSVMLAQETIGYKNREKLIFLKFVSELILNSRRSNITLCN